MILAHAGGIDELAMVLMPVIMGVGLFLITRRSGKEESQEDADISEDR